MESFKNLGLSDEALKVIKKKGFEVPTPIQEKTIPSIIFGEKDIVAQAQTGTGKTAAFGLPLLELINEDLKVVQVLVLTPTRELAIQVAEEINSLKGKKKINIIPVFGGQSINIQFKSLKKGVEFVIGTPGRILDHIRRRTLKLNNLSFLVLDEADEMLNMGFIDEVREIMEATNPDKRSLLFSATMPKEILQIAKKYMHDHDLIKVTGPQLTVSHTDQIYFEVSEKYKFDALCRIIDIEDEFYGLVFCRTRNDVDNVANHLIERGYDADALHGDMSQPIREKILAKFKKKRLNILVATDVASRGIDVRDLTHVINYNLPQDLESYVHRIGRTGRAGKQGIAITFITHQEFRRLQRIKEKTKTDIRKAKLPKIQDIIASKKQKIKSDIEDISKSSPNGEFLNLAKELLENNPPENIIAALLQDNYQNELDVKSYTKINDVIVDDTQAKTRLFVTQGKKDGLTKKKLISFIKEKSNVPSSKIRDITILEKFSFITLPFHDAELLLSHFSNRKRKDEPFITKAKKVKK